MTRQVLGTIIFTAVVTAITVGAVFQLTSSDGRGSALGQEPTASPAGDAAPAVSVQVVSPTLRPVTRSLRMPASLVAGEMADLFAKTSGYVSEVKVDIGDRVAAGDALLVIDVPEMADELRQTEAVLSAKKARATRAAAMVEIAEAEELQSRAEHLLSALNHARRSTLRRGNAIPQQQLDEANSELAIADARIRTATARVASAKADAAVADAEALVAEAHVAWTRTLMAYATIVAPFAGVITARHVDTGAFVRSAADGTTTALLSISRTDFIRVALEIPEVDAPFVGPGTEVEIDVKALDRPPIKATVTRTAGALKPETRSMRAEVQLQNPDGDLKPGMYAQVTITLETRQQAVMVPSRAIRVRGRDISIMVAEGSVAKSIPVKLGYDDGIWVEITSGLSGEEQVIVAANGAVSSGDALRAVPLTVEDS